MSITLTTAWRPRGEWERFIKNLPLLRTAYQTMVVTLPPEDSTEVAEALNSLPDVTAVITREWSQGRYLALQQALETGADHLHYVDFDRLLHWVETRPVEWRQSVQSLPGNDCILFGRTQAAQQTHPRALVETEWISNRVTSFVLGQDLDISAGARGFSRRAAAFLVQHASTGHALGADAEWLVLLARAGFGIHYQEVDGLDWESADHFQAAVASTDQQRSAAEAYDGNPGHWRQRVDVARQIVEAGLEAAQRPLPPLDLERYAAPATGALAPDQSAAEFDVQAVFDVDDYMYFYDLVLTDAATDQQIAALIQWLPLEQPAAILDLACGYGRHANRLAALGHRVTGIDLTEGFLALARQDALQRAVAVTYRQGDMRQVDEHEQYEAVLLLFTDFGYFDDETNLAVLRRAAHALKPDGHLVFDIPNRDTFLKGFLPQIVTEKEGNLMIDLHRFDTLSGRLYNRRIVIRDGVRKEKPFFVRLYNPSEIGQALLEAGLEIEQVYGGWDSSPASIDSRRMIIVAHKAASRPAHKPRLTKA